MNTLPGKGVANAFNVEMKHWAKLLRTLLSTKAYKMLTATKLPGLLIPSIIHSFIHSFNLHVSAGT